MKKYIFTKMLRSYGDINQNGNEEMTFADIRDVEVFDSLEEAKNAKQSDIVKFKQMVEEKSIVTFHDNEWYSIEAPFKDTKQTVWWCEIKIPFSNGYEIHEYKIFERD
jgi:protein associated with RNAse G/E